MRIKEHMEKANIDRRKLAMLTGVSERTVAKWENGTDYPRVSILPVMAYVFGCSIKQLLEPSKEA